MLTEIPKINLELPQGDDRSIQVWHTEIKDGAINVCISIKEKDSLLEEQHAATDLLHESLESGYPYDLINIREIMKKEDAFTQEECAEIGISFCSTDYLEQELEKYYTTRRKIREYLRKK